MCQELDNSWGYAMHHGDGTGFPSMSQKHNISDSEVGSFK